MKAVEFCYWAQGYFEISNGASVGLSAAQVDVIRRHLNLVFKHEIDPSYGNEKHQEELNSIHNAPTGVKPDWREQWIKRYGPCPYPGWEVGMHGWYNPAEGTPRC